MGELTVTCPICGTEIHAPDEDGLATKYKEHAHEAHGMEMSEEDAKQAIKIWLEG
jgi:predicted small metal-binding protein